MHVYHFLVVQALLYALLFIFVNECVKFVVFSANAGWSLVLSNYSDLIR